MRLSQLSSFVSAANSSRRWVLPAVGIVATSTLALLAAGPKKTAAPKNVDWRTYEANQGGNHYSPLTQINQSNVSKLKVAWSYEIGASTSVANPIIVNGVMYVIGKDSSIAALDAATGKELWSTPKLTNPRLRGFVYWESLDKTKRRIVFTNRDHLLQLDAATGKQVADFDVDLKLDLERDPASIAYVQQSSPGRVWGDTMIVGSSPGEEYGSPVGDIRAYDLNTGKKVWTFKTIPTPDMPEARTWGPNPRAFNGAANSWTGMSVDEKRGIVYCVTGSATYDYWGVDRPGDNLYADSLLAIDIRTGKKLWHFQDVHHDVWDYDLASTPVQFSARSNGKLVDAVAIAAKTGFLFAFDRVTGKPLFPIEERPVPQGEHMEGEKLSPTQPFPTVLKPFARQNFTVEDIDPAIPEPERTQIKNRMAAARWEGIFTPPSEKETLQAPGSNGGGNFGMTAADPVRGRVYVISFDVPAVIQMTKTIPMQGAGNTPMERGRSLYQQNCSVCHGPDRAGQAPAIPSLIGVGARLTPEQIMDTVNRGKPPMPAFPSIVGQSMTDLLTYVNNGFMPSNAPRPKINEDFLKGEPRWRTEYGYWYSKSGNSVVTPPWSSMTAYDMNTGAQLWSVPVGNDPDYPIKGKKTGMGQLTKVGIAVTAGNLIFVATPHDKTLTAMDPDTGKTLWETTLPEAAMGIPSVYAVNGKEYLVVPAASGNAGKTKRPASDIHNSYVVYTLPEGAK